MIEQVEPCRCRQRTYWIIPADWKGDESNVIYRDVGPYPITVWEPAPARHSQPDEGNVE